MRYVYPAKNYIEMLKSNGNYRYFLPIKNTNSYLSYSKNNKYINWCNNDYNRITQNNFLKQELIESINEYGIGAGGTRNISGSSPTHFMLEDTVAKLHKKDKGLIFNSGFIANFSTIETLGNLYSNASIFSDSDNHSSIIKGIKISKIRKKKIFKHNDMNHLEYLLKNDDAYYKIIVIESMYSMDGSIAPLKDICFLKEKYNTFTFIDEIHAVGVYGKTGGGFTEIYNLQDKFDIIMGGFGKGFGSIGGYITGNEHIIDSVRSNSSGFIFTTAPPPHISLSTIKNINFVQNNIIDRQIHRNKNIKYFKQMLEYYDIPYIKNNFYQSHIIAILIGDSIKCNEISKILLEKYNHYVQPINYPTVPMGTERFRISINFDHTKLAIDNFIKSLHKILKSYD